jgi:hypothetical protein
MSEYWKNNLGKCVAAAALILFLLALLGHYGRNGEERGGVVDGPVRWIFGSPHK